ncbi:hypothetical protein CERSUDRAFT_113422, partial [Gelatoporia subvermispora B]
MSSSALSRHDLPRKAFILPSATPCWLNLCTYAVFPRHSYRMGCRLFTVGPAWYRAIKPLNSYTVLPLFFELCTTSCFLCAPHQYTRDWMWRSLGSLAHSPSQISLFLSPHPFWIRCPAK